MTEGTFAQKLAELEARMAGLTPELREALMPLLDETRKRHAEIQRNTILARDALDDWRIAMKYKIFDAEASQRENPR